MQDIRTFVEWLGFHPSCDEITRIFVTDYFAPHGASSARIGRLHPNDALEFIGQYGFDAGEEKQIFDSEVWRSWDHDEALIALGSNSGPWNQTKDLLVIPLRERGAIQGYVGIRFARPVNEMVKIEECARDYAVAIALYLSLANTPERDASPHITQLIERGTDQLTPRQVLILRGMAEGKTNHELANELGFSVSTIRHETMRIYQSLAVSDRKEAAKKALSLALI